MNTISRDDFLSSISRIAGSVYDFHKRFGVPALNGGSPDQTLATLRSRLAFLAEEMGEHAKELNRGNVPDAAVELADVAFVALGSLLVLDNAGCDASLTVARKNDAKTEQTHVFEKSSGKLVRRVP